MVRSAFFLMRRRGLAAVVIALVTACSTSPAPRTATPDLADTHVHLSYGTPENLLLLVRSGVVAVRDCGGDLDQLLQWRSEITAGRRIGPRIYLSGLVPDGPKEGGAISKDADERDRSRRSSRCARERWWKSPAGEEAIQRLARSGVTIVPTLVRYEASIAAAGSEELRSGRAALLPELHDLVGRLHAAGVPILAGSDLVEVGGSIRPEEGPAREIELLQQAGLAAEAARRAASPDALARSFER